MNIKQYYIIKSDSEISKSYNKWETTANNKCEERKKYLFDELKADEVKCYDSGVIHSLTFTKGIVIPEGLMVKKNNNGFYSPNRRTKAGKEISKKFLSFDMGSCNEAEKMLNHNTFFGNSNGNMCMCIAQLWKNKNNVLVAIIPVSEINPYTPVEGMTEITSSVFNKIQNHQSIEKIS